MTSQRQRQLRSSTACRRRLDDLYMPILERMDNGEFSEEGGSDAYDRAMAELRDAYQATPNLGCMMNEEWETFIRSHTLDDQVKIEDLDEPDEAATNQLGTCQPGNDADSRLQSEIEAARRRMQEGYTNNIGDPSTRSEVAMMNEEWETSTRSHTLDDQVEIEDLDEPDEAATNQLGTCQPGIDADIRLPSETDLEAVRMMEEVDTNNIGDPNTRSEVAMMNEEWETSTRSHALDQVEIEDLDEPDEAATNQLGTCQPGNVEDIRRLPSGEIDPEDVRRRMEKAFINSIGDPNTRSEVERVIKVVNVDAMRNSSSVACRARLQELFQPIEYQKKKGAYKGEEGHTLYQVHLEKVKQEYLDTPDLGVMKGTEWDKFVESKKDASKRIRKWDEEATKEAEAKQKTILGHFW